MIGDLLEEDILNNLFIIEVLVGDLGHERYDRAPILLEVRDAGLSHIMHGDSAFI